MQETTAELTAEYCETVQEEGATAARTGSLDARAVIELVEAVVLVTVTAIEAAIVLEL